MNKTHNASLKPFTQSLRREMTKEERKLWYEFLKSLPCTVNRQKVIGKYNADFYIASANLVIELDGSQHYQQEGLANDQARDAYFREEGITVLRYSNLDILRRFSGVCEDILSHLS